MNTYLNISLWAWISACLYGLFPLMTFSQVPYEYLYVEHCAGCHGKNFEGNAHTPSLVDGDLRYGEDVTDFIKGIKAGYPERGMPGFQTLLSEGQVKGIAIYLSEQRKNFSYRDFSLATHMQIPSSPIQSEKGAFRIETVAKGLDPWPYSIAPLPEGGFLLSEKTRGLSLISPAGEQSELVKGLPRISSAKESGVDMQGLLQGQGWMLEVALHPDYAENGWIYISYGDKCTQCNEQTRKYRGSVSMLRVIRGRIRDGMWVDQEVIWEVDKEQYTNTPETSIGGRMAFDDKGYLYLTTGAKRYTPHHPGTIEAFGGIQDLSMPYGKIHRVHDDGRIPLDNPFVDSANALGSIWTVGHRSPQGLEYDPTTHTLWGTEMGPRGGDEVNLIQKGQNYGWPLVSKGVNYTGTDVAFGQYLEMDPLEMELEDPVVDLTPSPAVSSLIVCNSDKYPGWQGNLLVGTLKATQLMRMEVKDGKLIRQEILIDHLARIRDIEVGYDGYIYLLLEHKSGAVIVRLIPVP